jgi:hypothetical protein
MSEQIPSWAVELTRQVTILNERLPTHVEWTERNIKDHELRIRASEATLSAMNKVEVRIDELDKRVRDTEKKLWIAYGSLTALFALLEVLTRFFK